MLLSFRGLICSETPILAGCVKFTSENLQSLLPATQLNIKQYIYLRVEVFTRFAKVNCNKNYLLNLGLQIKTICIKVMKLIEN